MACVQVESALLRLGHGKSLVAGLAARTGATPLDERLAGQHIRALHRAGRTADALAHYRHVQEQLGTDPRQALRDLHQQVLNSDPDLIGVPVAAGERLVPRQLPAAPPLFVGRRHEIDLLDAMPGEELLIDSFGSPLVLQLR